MILTRRRFVEGAATFALATAAFGLPLNGFSSAAYAQQKVDMAELMKPSPLGDMAMGDEKAPVTVVEYASLSCIHCAHFAVETFPEFKKRYVDTGKVRYILREFPFDRIALAAFMIARCAANNNSDKYFAVVDTLFHQRETWFVEKPIEPLLAISKQVGLTQQTFEDCLSNQDVAKKIDELRKHASEKLGVDATPTFFINGEKFAGALSIDEMAKAIDPYLKS